MKHTLDCHSLFRSACMKMGITQASPRATNDYILMKTIMRVYKEKKPDADEDNLIYVEKKLDKMKSRNLDFAFDVLTFDGLDDFIEFIKKPRKVKWSDRIQSKDVKRSSNYKDDDVIIKDDLEKPTIDDEE